MLAANPTPETKANTEKIAAKNAATTNLLAFLRKKLLTLVSLFMFKPKD